MFRNSIVKLCLVFVALGLAGGCTITSSDRIAGKLIVDAETPEARVYRGYFIAGALANIGAMHIDDPDTALSLLASIKHMGHDLKRAEDFVKANEAAKHYIDIPFIFFAKSTVKTAKLALPIEEFRNLANSGIKAAGSANPLSIAIGIARSLWDNTDNLIMISRLRQNVKTHFASFQSTDGGKPTSGDLAAIRMVVELGCTALAEIGVKSEFASGRNASTLVTDYCKTSDFSGIS